MDGGGCCCPRLRHSLHPVNGIKISRGSLNVVWVELNKPVYLLLRPRCSCPCPRAGPVSRSSLPLRRPSYDPRSLYLHPRPSSSLACALQALSCPRHGDWLIRVGTLLPSSSRSATMICGMYRVGERDGRGCSWSLDGDALSCYGRCKSGWRGSSGRRRSARGSTTRIVSL